MRGWISTGLIRLAYLGQNQNPASAPSLHFTSNPQVWGSKQAPQLNFFTPSCSIIDSKLPVWLIVNQESGIPGWGGGGVGLGGASEALQKRDVRVCRASGLQDCFHPPDDLDPIHVTQQPRPALIYSVFSRSFPSAARSFHCTLYHHRSPPPPPPLSLLGRGRTIFQSLLRFKVPFLPSLSLLAVLHVGCLLKCSIFSLCRKCMKSSLLMRLPQRTPRTSTEPPPPSLQLLY